MNNELLLLIEKHTDSLVEKTKTKTQGTLVFKLNKQMETFSTSPPINLSVERKWLLGVSSIEATNSVLNTTEKHTGFSKTMPGHCNSHDGGELINKLNKIFQLRSGNGIALHVKGVEKTGTRIEI